MPRIVRLTEVHEFFASIPLPMERTTTLKGNCNDK